jgi:tocopherol O-methyltransferase
VTISGRQVEIAQKLSSEVPGSTISEKDGTVKLGSGSVRFLELDAEKMGDFFTAQPNKATFDVVWISEAMSHLPNKELFFRNAALLLNPGGKLVVADWFKNEGLTEKQMDADIKPIEGMFCFVFVGRIC